MKKVLFKKTTLRKKNFYKWFKETLVSVGWENISSRPSTDFDVFFSKGESGKEELYFQMKEFLTTQTNETLSATTSQFFDVKMLLKYTPGAPGVSGVLDRPGEAFRRLQIASRPISTEADIDIYYNINKDRAIVMFEYPVGLEEHSVLFMIGKPDNPLAKHFPNGSMINFATQTYSYLVAAVDQADFVNPSAATLSTYENIPPKFRNSAGVFLFSELGVGDAKEGFRALIDGVYVGGVDLSIFAKSTREDYLLDEFGNKYKIFYLDTRTNTSYQYYAPTRYMALMVEEGTT